MHAERTRFLKTLVDTARSLDGSRLISAAMEFHGDQEDLYRKTIAMLSKIPAWRGVTPWILADFRSPRRVLPNVQAGWNRKGLIGQNGTKKKAFAVLKSFYDELAARGK